MIGGALEDFLLEHVHMEIDDRKGPLTRGAAGGGVLCHLGS